MLCMLCIIPTVLYSIPCVVYPRSVFAVFAFIPVRLLGVECMRSM